MDIVNDARARLLVLSTVLLASLAPASAAGIIVRCAIPQACAAYKNTLGYGVTAITVATGGKHAAVVGADVATNNGLNDGLLGTVLNGGYGVEGSSGDNALGGVRGVGTTGLGVYGSSNTSYGAYGSSGSSVGVVGSSGSGTGMLASSFSGTGLESDAPSGSAGRFITTSGNAVEAISGTGYGLIARTGGSVGAYVVNTNGNGTDITGSYIALLGRSNAYPLLLTNAAAANLFYVDGSGNVWSHGTYNTFAVTRSGGSTLAYSTQSTTPNVEDVGAAQLVNGAATVEFDAAFAASIDGRSTYHVFLTPGGDTRGLFVAAKTPTGFVVRETQGGRNSLAFDYRIVATAVGHSRERMAFVRPAAAGPKAGVLPYLAAPATKRQAVQEEIRKARRAQPF